ncbi:hypothetical protein EX30DRAFT_218752 [Ascodesmis nigricans]|uniref:Uncharacterized protein n=1 Tax=Ascodesmis nigricans TaxID=341454 RepID=A0A4S2MZI0_9PEZI|nr:hypothetical protein EX30DRAFT_218752 [Ascodesmis nigricans]
MSFFWDTSLCACVTRIREMSFWEFLVGLAFFFFFLVKGSCICVACFFFFFFWSCKGSRVRDPAFNWLGIYYYYYYYINVIV